MATARALGFVRHYLLAIQFFTRLPVTGPLAEWVGHNPAMLGASAAHLPGVGWLVGVTACAVFALLSLLLPDTPLTPLAAAVGSTIATVLLTGGFHEGGLADMADRLGGSPDQPGALEIMEVKDSRLGTHGVLALNLALMTKLALLAVLASFSPPAVMAALLGAHVLSRLWPLLLLRALSQGGATGAKGKPLADRIEPWALVIALGWCLVPLALVAFVQGLSFLAWTVGMSAMATAALWHLIRRRLRGFTGDCMGATQQVSEIAFYLGAAAALGGA
nr:adenosylcobinamide-GDP ribazoletransferase [Ramlibacter tataouinensis]